MRGRQNGQLQFGVMLGSGQQCNPRGLCHLRNRHDDREHGFEDIALANTHIEPQIVAACRFDPSDSGYEVFGTGHFQHGWRVDLLRRTHSQPHRIWNNQIPDNGWSQSKVRYPTHTTSALFVAPFQNGTRLSPILQCTNQSSRSHSPLVAIPQSASASVGCSRKDDLRGHQGSASADTQVAVQGHRDAPHSRSRQFAKTRRKPVDLLGSGPADRPALIPPEGMRASHAGRVPTWPGEHTRRRSPGLLLTSTGLRHECA
jgi:hypothetical protein